LVPSGLNVIPVGELSSLLILSLSINTGSAKASDEKNKLNKIKNTLGLRTLFIISSLFFLKKKKFNIFVDLSFFKILSMKMY
jgi:hypothetical protein